MKKTIMSIITALSFLSATVSFASGEFTDVSSNDWYYDSVESAVSLGIINGKGDGTFAPDDKLTVAEAVTLASKINASYFQKVMPVTSGESVHWADEFFGYAIDNEIIEKDTFSNDDYDRAIKRGEMFELFASVLPESEYTKVNNITAIPAPAESESVEKLFSSGIVIGSDSGFEADKDITRAETAAICVRIIDPEKRIVIEDDSVSGIPADKSEPDDADLPLPETENSGTADETGEETNAENSAEAVEPLIYSIPLTFWDEGDNVTGAPVIRPGEANGIKTRFSNHTYGTEKQSEYGYVMEALDEAYKYTAGEESQIVKDPYSAYNTYKAGRITREKLEKRFRELLRDDKAMKVLFDENLAVVDDTVYSNFYRAYRTADDMMDYLIDEYVVPNKKSGVGGPDGINDNVYRYLAKRGNLDYEGWTNMQMAVYDYLGFSTRAVETSDGKCRGAQILLCGEWVCVELMNEDMCLINATADQLKLYCESNGKTGKGEEPYLKGLKNDGAVTDLKVVISPTHLPGNYDYDAK